MRKTKRSRAAAPAYGIAAISILLCISGVALAYGLMSGRISARNPVVETSGIGAAPVASPGGERPTATADAPGVPVSGSPVIPGASCIPDHETETGTVIEVLDGDSINVKLDRNGDIYPVHYAGVDAPESRTEIQYFGMEATMRNAELVGGRTVTLIKDVSETDQVGQLLRYVLTDTAFVNYELIAQGFAHTLAELPDTACISTFEAAEAQASGLKLGLWGAAPTFVSPGSNAPCSCIGSELDCADFDTQVQSQICLDHCKSQGYGDPFDLDYDGDGKACEQLP